MCWITAIIMAFAMVVPMSVSAVEMSGAEDYSSISDVQNSEQNIKQSIEENKTSIENTESVNDKGEKVEINTRNADAEYVVEMTNDKTGEIQKYSSLNEAIDAAIEYTSENGKPKYTLKLLKDVKEDVVITSGKYITIDLNGKKITNANRHTITNMSTNAKIKDSKGEGIVDNITHGKSAIYNDINSTITLESGTFTRSAEASTDANDNGGNSWYVIKNYGTMTIKNGVTVKFPQGKGLFSSLIANGWQNSAAAENGSSEPKPSAGKNKATLKISGGEFTGGKITIKNDDYGVLNISGGEITQNNDSYYAVYNANVATISGGNIKATGENGVAVRTEEYSSDANKGTLTVSGGTLESPGNVLYGVGGAEIIIKDGSFKTDDNEAYIVCVDGSSMADITGGTYIGINDMNKIVNSEATFGEGKDYEPKEGDDDQFTIGYKEESVVAVVKDIEGNETQYIDLRTALSNAPAGSTVTLMKSVRLEKTAATENYGVTIDLNGFNIDGSAVTNSNGVVSLAANYGSDPIENGDNTMRLINSKNTGGVITGTLPVTARCGNSNNQLPIVIGDTVTLEAIGAGDAVKLESSAYLIYSDKNAGYFSNGMFKATDNEGQQRIYGQYANAAKIAADGVVTLLHDYKGADKINSGNVSMTLDLNGHTYTYTGSETIVDVNYPGVTLTIKDGVLMATDENSDGIQMVGFSNQQNDRGIVLENVNITVPGEAYGIATNGTETGNSIVMRNSTLNVKNGFGIYFPSAGRVVIDNSVINAEYTGVQMCAGSLKITGDRTEINVTGEPQPKTEGDGVIADGAAVSIIERDGYKDLGTVSIEAGRFTSAENVDAVKAYTFNNTDKEEGEWEERGTVVDISGGIFSTEVAQDLCADKYVPAYDEETGMYTVEKDMDPPVIRISGTENELTAGTYYGGELKFTVEDKSLESVKVNDPEINLNPDDNGVYTITGAGSYSIVAEDAVGNKTEIEVTIESDKGVISEDTAKITLKNNLTANGTEQTQLVEVVVGGVILTEDVDYSVTGNTATEAGTYTLTIKGIGNYKGEVSVQYTVSEQQGTTEEPGGTTGDNQGEDQNNKNDSSAKTGDDFNAAPLIALMGITAAAAAGTALYGRRKNEGR